MKAILEINNLRKRFGGVQAVDNVSFSVEEGSRLGIIGPNGAGKTTTFNMISGAIKPTSGTIELAGQRISGLKPHRIAKLGVGRTFQNVRAFGQLSVYEHVLTGAVASQFHFMPTPEQHEEVERILELTRLQEVREAKVCDLTIAAQKKITLATALATKPRLLLLDELMAGLTFVEIEETLELLRKVNKEMGVTLIVVEHIMKAVMGLCERIIVLDYGEMIASGTPKEVANNKAVIEAYLGEEVEYARG